MAMVRGEVGSPDRGHVRAPQRKEGMMSTKKQRVYWGIPGFDRQLKNEFVYACKMEDKDWKLVLFGLLRKYVLDKRKEKGYANKG
jgi:hypothetical protein